MDSLLNHARPPVFCPGCTHEKIVKALDRALCNMGLSGDRIALVSDIGCSGLFDTFFNTHAFHGLHGRALTYAAGLKLARPKLNVITTMGDGGLGIGGAHLLAACRRNLDMTLLVLNNFNFGMTGGQFSPTTPVGAKTGSAFLNQLEMPMDVCQVAVSSGAAYVNRCSGHDGKLPEIIERAIRYPGFAVIDIWGICPGRYTRGNRITPDTIREGIAALPAFDGPIAANERKEYGRHYREIAAGLETVSPPAKIEVRNRPPDPAEHRVVILGEAGRRIITAGEILCLAGMSAGLHATQKNEYDITVLRGPSITEVILSPDAIDFTGIEKPSVVLALSSEGVKRKAAWFRHFDHETFVVQAKGIDIPECGAKTEKVDFKAMGINKKDWALASLAVLARLGMAVDMKMLASGLEARFKGKTLETALETLEKTM